MAAPDSLGKAGIRFGELETLHCYCRTHWQCNGYSNNNSVSAKHSCAPIGMGHMGKELH